MNHSKREQIPFGSDFRIRINITNLGENTRLGSDNVGLTATFRVAGAELVFDKSQLTKIDDDTYVAPIHSAALARGDLMLETHTTVPDAAFPDGIRDELGRTDTNVTII